MRKECANLSASSSPAYGISEIDPTLAQTFLCTKAQAARRDRKSGTRVMRCRRVSETDAVKVAFPPETGCRVPIKQSHAAARRAGPDRSRSLRRSRNLFLFRSTLPPVQGCRPCLPLIMPSPCGACIADAALGSVGSRRVISAYRTREETRWVNWLFGAGGRALVACMIVASSPVWLGLAGRQASTSSVPNGVV
jgi:hypothetical protein